MMKVTLIRGQELDGELAEAWIERQKSNPHLANPNFHPEFTRAIAEARSDVEIAVIEVDGAVTAFFPFQREKKTAGSPVGGIISDYHGIICSPDFSCDFRDVIRRCGLTSWTFDHLIAAQTMFTSFHGCLTSSPVIDLRNGFGAYAGACHAVRAEGIKLRRLERGLGLVRIESGIPDEKQLALVLGWKSAQYRQAGNRDIFGISWIRAAVERIHATQTPGFGGILSMLYAGDTAVAGHFGMRAGDIWHYWFPAYAPEHSRYSPGLSLLLKMAQTAEGLGLRTIDLGKGEALYKRRFMNSEVALAEGTIESSSWRSLQRTIWQKLRSTIGAFPLGQPARASLRWFRKRYDAANGRRTR